MPLPRGCVAADVERGWDAMDSREHEELVAIRTQLTIATLAVAQLQRRHAHSGDAARLLAHIDTALQRITREARRVDTLLAHLEDRAAIEADPLRLRGRGVKETPPSGGESEPPHPAEKAADDKATPV